MHLKMSTAISRFGYPWTDQLIFPPHVADTPAVSLLIPLGCCMSLFLALLFETFCADIVNTLRPKLNCRLFAHGISECIFLNENVWIWFNFSLKIIAKVRLSHGKTFNPIFQMSVQGQNIPGGEQLQNQNDLASESLSLWFRRIGHEQKHPSSICNYNDEIRHSCWLKTARITPMRN